MTTTPEADRQQFAEAGANIIGIIDQQIERDDLPPGVREAFAILRDWATNMTAAQVKAMKDAEQVDGVLFGASPSVIVHALRQHLSPGQCTQLAAMLTEG